MINPQAHAIFQPGLALLLWSLVMWIQMFFTRIPAMMKAQAVLNPDIPPKDLTRSLPPRVRWGRLCDPSDLTC